MKKILLVILLISSNFYCQLNTSLAEINDIEISIKEFKERIELSPFLTKHGNNENKKKEFLLTLVAEKLLALEAEKSGLNNNFEYKLKLENLNKKLVRDKLFEKEIVDQINLSNNELKEAVNKSSISLFCNFLLSDKKNEIDRLYNKLKQGVNIDSLLLNRKELSEQSKPIKVEYGQMDERIENILYSLSKNEFTIPININGNWVIYYVRDINTSTPDFADSKFRKKIRDILKNRKLAGEYNKYYSKLMKGVLINADRELYEELTEKIFEYSNKFEKGKKFELTFKMIQEIKHQFKMSIRNEPFVKFSKNPVNLEDFLNEMSVDGLIIFPGEKKNIRDAVNVYIKDFTNYEMLYREAKKLKYDKSLDIFNTIKIWKDNYLSSLYRKKIIKEINKRNSNSQNISVMEELNIEIAKLSNKYNLKINFDKLNQIKVIPINVLVYKNYGFGGSGIVYPHISNFSDWYEIKKTIPKDFH